MKRYRRLVRRGLAALALVLLGCSTVTGDLGARRLVHPPRRTMTKWLTETVSRTAECGVSVTPFAVQSADHLQLAAIRIARDPAVKTPCAELLPYWKKLPADLRSAPPGSRGLVVLLHGFGNRKEQMLPIAERLTWAGFACIAADSRAHGESEGDCVTFGREEAADVAAVVQTARRLWPDLPDQVFLTGFSMGGAIALQALDQMPDVRAVVTISTFDRLSRVMRDQLSAKTGRFTSPVIACARLSTRLRAGFDPAGVRPVDSVARHSQPMLFIHGSADTFVSPASAAALQAKAAGHSDAVIVPGASHWSVFYDERPDLSVQIARFLDHAGRTGTVALADSPY